MPLILLSLISGAGMRLSLEVYFIKDCLSFLLTWFLIINSSSKPTYVTRFLSQDLRVMWERKRWVKVKLLMLSSVLWAWWVLIGLTAYGRLGGSSNLGKRFIRSILYAVDWFLPLVANSKSPKSQVGLPISNNSSILWVQLDSCSNPRLALTFPGRIAYADDGFRQYRMNRIPTSSCLNLLKLLALVRHNGNGPSYYLEERC